jgi:hypothetical protein
MKAIKTYYLPPTNFRGSRIVATDMDRNKITLVWNSNLDRDENHIGAAKALCTKMDWKGELVMGGFPKFNVHVFVERKY